MENIQKQATNLEKYKARMQEPQGYNVGVDLNIVYKDNPCDWRWIQHRSTLISSRTETILSAPSGQGGEKSRNILQHGQILSYKTVKKRPKRYVRHNDDSFDQEIQDVKWVELSS